MFGSNFYYVLCGNQIMITSVFQDVKWLQTITSLPILLKGIMTAEDSKCSF
jgi:isopentenyl diphosphate isomerase/L-lactate dehydrogenase-like FMN-dependent dehydrogenase